MFRRASRRSISLLAATAVVGAAAFAGAGAAAADAGATVTGVHTADSGGLDIGLLDPDALWVQATVRGPASDGAPVLAQTDDLHFDWTRGWFTDTPLHLADGTAYGDYPVDIDYRLASGTTQHWAGADHGAAALFAYHPRAGVTAVAFDRTATDYDHQQATLAGSVQTFDPASGTSTAAADGTKIRLIWNTVWAGNTQTSHSALAATSAGRFHLLITPHGRVTDGTAAVVGTAALLARAATPLPSLDEHGIQVRITGGPAHVRVHAGKQFTVSGTAQRLTASGWRALAGAAVVTTPGAPDQWGYTTHNLMGSGTTGSTGHFSYRITAHRAGAFNTYVRPSDYLAADRYLMGQLDVPTAGTITGLKFALDEFGQVSASGALHGRCGQQSIVLQYATNGRTGWVRVGSGFTGYQSGTRACRFTVTGPGRVDGYYRVTHAESDTVLTLTAGHQRLHRTPTKITFFGLSPARPALNAPITATGTLRQLVGKHWKALAGARVVMVFRQQGDTTWYWVVKGRTTGSGHFSLKAKAYGTGSWGVYYNADASHFYSQSPARAVTVR